MLLKKCKWDTIDEITGCSVCVNPDSRNFSMTKSTFCSDTVKGCKYWEPWNGLDALFYGSELEFKYRHFFGEFL